MAKKWSEVAQSEAFLALPAEQKEQARNQYFDQVVAPQIGDPSQVSVARQQFDSQTRITDLPGVNAEPPDFSDVTAQTDTTAERVRNPANDSAFARMVSGQAAPQPEGSALGRFLGQIGGREVLQGAYGLYGSLGGDAIDYAVLGPIDRKLGTNLGTGGRGYRQAASDLADSMGMYKPQTAEDRIISGVGEALTGTGLTLGIGGGLNALANMGRVGAGAGRVGNFLAAQPVLQGVSAATGSAASGAVRESGGSQGQQLAAGLLGGLAPGVAGATAQAAVRGAVRGTSGQQMRNTLADFNALGANPSVGQASGNRLIQGAENLLAGGPTSAGVMSRFAERQADNIGAGLRQMGESLARNASGERAGRAVERGVSDFVGRSGDTGRDLYKKVDDAISASTRVGVSNTQSALKELNSAIEGAPNVGRFFQNARIQGIERSLLEDTDGTAAALSRPEVKAEADRIRQGLQEQASARRAEVAQGANQQRSDLQAANASHRARLESEADQLRNRLHDAVEGRRSQLYREADELEVSLRQQQAAAIAENRRMSMLPGISNARVPVISDAEIASRVPTRASIDARLPSRADIEAQVPTAKDIEAQLMDSAEINRRVSPDSSFQDANFGSDYIEAEVSRYLQSQVDGKLPYEALTKLRTLVGNELENYSLVDNVPRSKWKALYGALSRDMEAAATSPEARAAWNRANNYYSARISRIEQVQRVVDKNGGPEAVFNAVMQGTKDGGTTLRSVMQSLPKEGQQAVTAAVIKRMGMPTPGQAGADAAEQFSASTFLTNWNRVSPEARRALFDRHGPQFSRDMDRIARVADNIKTGAKVYANPSGTANRAAAMTYGAALVASLFDPSLTSTGGLLVSGAAANGGARLLTSPRAVHWLAQATQMPRGAFISSLRMMANGANKAGHEDMVELSALLEKAVDEHPDSNQQQ